MVVTKVISINDILTYTPMKSAWGKVEIMKAQCHNAKEAGDREDGRGVEGKRRHYKRLDWWVE